MLRLVAALVLFLFAIGSSTETVNKTETWNGIWFPGNPLKDSLKKQTETLEDQKNDTWKGKWFPGDPSKINDLSESLDTVETETSTKESSENNSKKQTDISKSLTNDTWNGKWFPGDPSKLNDLSESLDTVATETSTKESSENNFKKQTDISKSLKNDTWNGKWFPGDPSKKNNPSELMDTAETETTSRLSSENGSKKQTEKFEPQKKDTWKGNWFPGSPFKTNDLSELFDTTKTETNTRESWKGKWFPSKPKTKINPNIITNTIYVDPDCDDGKTHLKIDFDPTDKRHNYNYICLNRRSEYEPSFATYPIQREFIVPPAFKAPSYCINETIEFEERLPTFGAHRYLYPSYGEYLYIPPQRWMYNLEYGAIVMLYHPCANKMQVEKLRSTLNACAYRHIITPSQMLLAQRPLALVVWGKSLEMSVVDVSTVVDFIKNNANKGPASGEPNVQKYDAALTSEAKLVTDQADSDLCANINL